jgi:elongation of very long chain fatty acids protein 4
MSSWPGGDAYFGALLNSLIHVMMYSYYTLSLLKVSCPWKKYLTQAQLAQFTTVVIYSAATCFIHYRKQDAEAIHYCAIGIQIFEMTSMFVLFMHFYSKAYKKRKSAAKKSSSESENESDAMIPEQVSISSDSSSDEAKKEL